MKKVLLIMGLLTAAVFTAQAKIEISNLASTGIGLKWKVDIFFKNDTNCNIRTWTHAGAIPYDINANSTKNHYFDINTTGNFRPLNFPDSNIDYIRIDNSFYWGNKYIEFNSNDGWHIEALGDQDNAYFKKNGRNIKIEMNKIPAGSRGNQFDQLEIRVIPLPGDPDYKVNLNSEPFGLAGKVL